MRGEVIWNQVLVPVTILVTSTISIYVKSERWCGPWSLRLSGCGIRYPPLAIDVQDCNVGLVEV